MEHSLKTTEIRRKALESLVEKLKCLITTEIQICLGITGIEIWSLKTTGTF